MDPRKAWCWRLWQEPASMSYIHLFTQCTCVQNDLSARPRAPWGCTRGKRPCLQTGDVNTRSNDCIYCGGFSTLRMPATQNRDTHMAQKWGVGRSREGADPSEGVMPELSLTGWEWGRAAMAKRQQNQLLPDKDLGSAMLTKGKAPIQPALRLHPGRPINPCMSLRHLPACPGPQEGKLNHSLIYLLFIPAFFEKQSTVVS